MKKIFSFFATLLVVATFFAQGYVPITGIGTEAKPVQGNPNLICLGCYTGNLNAVVDASLNNSASMGNFTAAIAGNGISVKNTLTTYPAGYVTGFNIDMGTSFITVDLLKTLQISTYKDGVLQESTSASTLLSVPAFGGAKSRIFLHLKTTKAFNEVRITQTSVLNLFTAMNVYYAFAFDPAKMPVENNGVCDDIIGFGAKGTENDKVSVSGSSTGVSPLSGITNRANISDGDKNSYGEISIPLGVLGSYTVGLLDKEKIYPANNKAGFVISPDDEGKLLSAEFLKNITIETYLFGQLQDSKALSDGGGLINIKVLSFGSGKQKISLTTTKPFNEIRLKVTQTVGVNIGALKVYYAFEEPLTGCECDDKVQTSGSSVPGNIIEPGLFGGSWTSGPGFLGLVFAKMVDPGKIVDTNTNNYASAYLPAASLLSIFSSYVTVKTNTLQPVGAFAGFTLEKSANLVGLALFERVRVTLYNNDVETQSFYGSGSLITGNFFTTDSNKFYVGGIATKPFNRMKITFYSGTGLRTPQEYKIYNAFVRKDADGDGVPDCFDVCPNGDDSIDSNGNGIPDCADNTCYLENDKSSILDSDGDGVVDMCDQDSDNDGIPDAVEEDSNKNNIFADDDFEGDLNFISTLGDGVGNYLDLDSDNDGILDLFESGIPTSVINQLDSNKNGIIDTNTNIAFGKNGIADILETSPDSGIMKYPVKDTDGDGIPDFLDIQSNGTDYDLYVIGKGNLDTLGGGFISTINDSDLDGIQAVVDTDLVNRGAPNSPLSPYATFAKNGGVDTTAKLSDVTAVANDIKVYPNPVKAGENLYVKSAEGGVYTLYSAQGQLLKSDKFTGDAGINTSSLPAGIYIIKIETKSTVKSYKVIVK